MFLYNQSNQTTKPRILIIKGDRLFSPVWVSNPSKTYSQEVQKVTNLGDAQKILKLLEDDGKGGGDDAKSLRNSIKDYIDTDNSWKQVLNYLRGDFPFFNKAIVEVLYCAECQNIDDCTNKIQEKLIDDLGWDIFIYIGHSNETYCGNGKITPLKDEDQEIYINNHQLEDSFGIAIKQGLKVAVFASCNGFHIAQSLVKLGLPQVVFMKHEPRISAAAFFLEQLCYYLTNYKDIHESVILASQDLKKQQGSIYPSAYVLPSLFRHPQKDLYEFPQSWLKRFIREIKPTRLEAIAVTGLMFTSLLLPVQDLLLDFRRQTQAFYRDITNQLPQEPEYPPIRLLEIDLDSLKYARDELQIENLDPYKPSPMNREFLAKIVDKLTELDVNTIALNYFTYREEPKSELLYRSIENAINKNNTYFILPLHDQEESINPNVADSKLVLEGDASSFYQGYLTLPTFEQEDSKNQENNIEQDNENSNQKNKSDCVEVRKQPLAYLAAFSHIIKKNDPNNFPILNTKNSEENQNNCLTANILIKKSQESQNSEIKKYSNNKYQFWGLPILLDLTIPPNFVYETIPVKELLKDGLSNPEKQRIKEQIIIIASGGYEEAQDNFSIPLAIQYWCNPLINRKSKIEDCPKQFTGGKYQAYMVHHFLFNDGVVQIPDLWLIILAVIFSKTVFLMLKSTPQEKREQIRAKLKFLPFIYILISLQSYVSLSILLPYLFPSLIFWFYLAKLKPSLRYYL